MDRREIRRFFRSMGRNGVMAASLFGAIAFLWQAQPLLKPFNLSSQAEGFIILVGMVAIMAVIFLAKGLRKIAPMPTGARCPALPRSGPS